MVKVTRIHARIKTFHPNGHRSILNHQKKPQILAHVSIYQVESWVPMFDPQPNHWPPPVANGPRLGAGQPLLNPGEHLPRDVRGGEESERGAAQKPKVGSASTENPDAVEKHPNIATGKLHYTPEHCNLYIAVSNFVSGEKATCFNWARCTFEGALT